MSVAKQPPSRSRPSTPRSSYSPLALQLANQHVIRAVETLAKMVEAQPDPTMEAPPLEPALPAAPHKSDVAALNTAPIGDAPPAVKLLSVSTLSSQNRLERRRSNLKTQVSRVDGDTNGGASPPISPRKNVQWREYDDLKFFRRSPEPVDELEAPAVAPPHDEVEREHDAAPSDAVPSSSGRKAWWEGLEKVLSAGGRVLYQEIALLVGHMPLEEQELGRELQRITNLVDDTCQRLLPENLPESMAEHLSADVDELTGRFVGLAAAMNGENATDRGDLVVGVAAIAAVGAEAEERLRSLMSDMPFPMAELGSQMQVALDAIGEVAEDSMPSERHAYLHASVTAEIERMTAMFESLVVAVNNEKEASPEEKLLTQALGALGRTMEGAFTPQVLPMEAVKLDGKMRRIVEFGVEWLRREARAQGTGDIPSLVTELRRRAEKLTAEHRTRNAASRAAAAV